MSEEGSALNRDEAETSCVCKKKRVGLIDFLGQLFVSSSCCLFDQHLYHSSVFAALVCIHPGRQVCLYPYVTAEENEIPKV